MTTAYTSLLGLALPVTGELSGTWGDTVNTAITSLLDSAVAGTTSITTDADITLTTTTGASNQARQAIILWNPASGTVTRNITAPAQSKMYTVINASGGTQSIVIRGVGPTTGVTVLKGESALVAWNGSDFVKVSSIGGSLTLQDLTVTGNTILGDAAADTLTVNATSTFNAPVSFAGQVKLPSTGRSAAAALTPTNPAFLYGVASTYTDTTSSGTLAPVASFYGLAQPTLSTSNVTTYTSAATLYIANAPTTGGSATITNPYSLYVNAGAAYFGGGVSLTSITDSGNLTFTGTGNRITGDMSNATLASRMMFQTSTVNGNTVVGAIPNGTSVTSQVQLFSNSDPTNASFLQIVSNTTEAKFAATIAGTGTYLPMTFSTGGSERMRLDTSGNVGIGTSTPLARTNIYNASSNYPLFVQGGSAATAGDGGSIAFAVASGSAIAGPSTAAAAIRSLNTYAGESNGQEGPLAFYTNQRTGANTYTGLTERMRIDSSGNVGIGTSSPTVKLDITGNGSLISKFQNYAGASGIDSYVAEGTSAAPTALLSGRQILNYRSYGYDGASYIFVGGIDMQAESAFSVGANPTYLRFRTSPSSGTGVERMRIDSSGNVGIGNTVDNNTRVLTFNTVSGGSSSIQSITVGATNQALTFSTTFSTLQERMRIDGQGNVGIGTSSPGGKLDVTSSTQNIVVSRSTGSYAAFQRTAPTGQQAYDFYTINGVEVARITGDPSYLAFSTGSSAAERMRIDSSGNVGIGTSSPSTYGKLAVYGTNSGGDVSANVINYSVSAGTTTSLILNDTSGDLVKLMGDNAGSTASLRAVNRNSQLSFWTGSAGGSERMRIDSSGNLLVGTTTASSSLTNGFNAVQTGTATYISVGHLTGSVSGSWYASFAYNGTQIGTISQSGTTAVLYNVTSDQRLKENIQDSESSSSLIDALQVRQFDWKTDNTHQRYGFIAQELVTVAPEAVHQPVNEEEMMAVDYSKLVPMLIKEIQSLRKRLADAGIA